MQKVVSTLKTLLENNKVIKDDATEWVKRIIESKRVEFIPFNDLKNSKLLGKGGFGSITKADWTKKGNCVVYKKLINRAVLKNELEIYLHLSNYSDRIIRCLGVSQGNLI